MTVLDGEELGAPENGVGTEEATEEKEGGEEERGEEPGEEEGREGEVGLACRPCKTKQVTQREEVKKKKKKKPVRWDWEFCDCVRCEFVDRAVTSKLHFLPPFPSLSAPLPPPSLPSPLSLSLPVFSPSLPIFCLYQTICFSAAARYRGKTLARYCTH